VSCVHTHRFLFGRRGKKKRLFVLCIFSGWRRPRSSRTKITRILIAGDFQHLSVTFVVDFLTINWLGDLYLRGVLQHPDLLWGPPSLIFGGYRGPFTPGVNRWEHEADHSPPPVPGFRLSTATRYGLDGQGIESGEGEIFRNRRHRPWGPPSLLYNGYRFSSPGVKRPGRGFDRPPHLAQRLKKEYGYTPTPIRLHGVYGEKPYLLRGGGRKDIQHFWVACSIISSAGIAQ
jgi:hypothetical protein